MRGGRWRVPLRMCAKKNPLQVQLRFSLKPSKSVNNAAETAVIEIGGLPFRLDDSGVQLGGWEGAVGLSFGYRVSASETYRTDLLGEDFYAKVWLNSDAATLAPDASGSHFDYGNLAFGVRHRRLIWPELGPSTVTGVVGQSWYGGDPLARDGARCGLGGWCGSTTPRRCRSAFRCATKTGWTTRSMTQKNARAFGDVSKALEGRRQLQPGRKCARYPVGLGDSRQPCSGHSSGLKILAGLGRLFQP